MIIININITEYLSVCTDPIWFSFTLLLLIGPGKIYSYFKGGYYHLPREIASRKVKIIEKSR